MRGSVILPSYNDGRLLARCLYSLCDTRLDGGLEIVVVLDGSTDGSVEMLRRGLGHGGSGSLDQCVGLGDWKSLRITLVELKQNAGRSVARNRAVKASRGDWLFFLDADLRVGPNWAEALLAGLEDENQVGVGEMIYVFRQDRDLDSALFAGDPAADQIRRRDLAPYQRYLETRGPYKFREQAEMPARYFYTCNACVHRGLFERTGGFDERYRAWGGEDIDMGLKLEKAGARMRYQGAARALHAQERSFAAHCANLEIMGRESLPLLLSEHPQMLEALQLERMLEGVGGFKNRLLACLDRDSVRRLLLKLESLGLFSEGLYDLCVYLHYAGAYRRTRENGNETD